MDSFRYLTDIDGQALGSAGSRIRADRDSIQRCQNHPMRWQPSYSKTPLGGERFAWFLLWSSRERPGVSNSCARRPGRVVVSRTARV